MKLQMVGCSHHTTTVQVREQLAFSPEQCRDALKAWRQRHPDSEAVLLSTCNRVEMYVASEEADDCPTREEVAAFMADFHGMQPAQVLDQLLDRSGEEAVKHLFTVSCSLDSMVVGESQILAQVKQAYEMAREGDHAGTLMHLAFQGANRVAKRVQNETTIHQRRVSIPSVAVADFAKQIFETFDDKKVLVAGAGEMGQETLRYLIDEGAKDITIVNRSLERAEALAGELAGNAAPWEQLFDLVAQADLIVSTTGATEPIVTEADFVELEQRRAQRPLFILDLAVPRDFDPAIDSHAGVYLYSVDDLQEACNRNREEREKEWPKAQRIIADESQRFMAELNHRSTGPTIRRLTTMAGEIKTNELQRLMNKVGDQLDERQQQEIAKAFDRLVNKLLHPPLESLRSEADGGAPSNLLDALRRLFKI